MIAYALITFRETLEVGLVLGLVWSILKQANALGMVRWLVHGLVWGVVTSAALAVVALQLLGSFSGPIEKGFEGVIMLVGAALLTTLIVWLAKQKARVNALKVSVSAATAHPWGLFFIVYTAVLREGIETILFLRAAWYATQANIFLGATLGIGVAVGVCYALFKGLCRVPVRSFFTVSSVLLIAFAAGLVAHGIHELQSGGVFPVVFGELWNINPLVVHEGVYPFWHEKGAFGGLLKGLFGYNGNPYGMELLAYAVYLIAVGGTFIRSQVKQSAQSHLIDSEFLD